MFKDPWLSAQFLFCFTLVLVFNCNRWEWFEAVHISGASLGGCGRLFPWESANCFTIYRSFSWALDFPQRKILSFLPGRYKPERAFREWSEKWGPAKPITMCHVDSLSGSVFSVTLSNPDIPGVPEFRVPLVLTTWLSSLLLEQNGAICLPVWMRWVWRFGSLIIP